MVGTIKMAAKELAMEDNSNNREEEIEITGIKEIINKEIEGIKNKTILKSINKRVNNRKTKETTEKKIPTKITEIEIDKITTAAVVEVAVEVNAAVIKEVAMTVAAEVEEAVVAVTVIITKEKKKIEITTIQVAIL